MLWPVTVRLLPPCSFRQHRVLNNSVRCSSQCLLIERGDPRMCVGSSWVFLHQLRRRPSLAAINPWLTSKARCSVGSVANPGFPGNWQDLLRATTATQPYCISALNSVSCSTNGVSTLLRGRPGRVKTVFDTHGCGWTVTGPGRY